MSTYTWAWSDEESTYINKADSLFEIVETIIDYYYGDADEEDKHYNITELNGKFLVSIIVDDEAVEYEVDASLCEVSDFLHILARHENRPDTFAIRLEAI
jgi:hypothetical protein